MRARQSAVHARWSSLGNSSIYANLPFLNSAHSAAPQMVSTFLPLNNRINAEPTGGTSPSRHLHSLRRLNWFPRPSKERIFARTGLGPSAWPWGFVAAAERWSADPKARWYLASSSMKGVSHAAKPLVWPPLALDPGGSCPTGRRVLRLRR